MKKKTNRLFLLLFVLFVVLLFANIALGSVSLSLRETLDALFQESENVAHQVILFDIRLPKAITAILAGSSLAVAGLFMQTLFRNPLADPFVLGINSGASLGVAIIMLFLGSTGITLLEGFGGGLTEISVAFAATLGAGFILAFIMALSTRVNMMTLLIIGLMIGYATSAISSILMFLSIPERVQQYLAWTFGDFGRVDWDDLSVFIPLTTGGLSIAFLCSKPLNAWILGEDYAKSVGVKTQITRFIILVSSAVLTGAVTTFCGPIGFIGIAAPHFCRAIFNTSNHRILVPGSILAGAIIGLTADLIAQVPGSRLILPLNAITSLIGAPVIIWVLLKSKQYPRNFSS